MAVHVEGDGDPTGLEQRLQEAEVAHRGFLRDEGGPREERSRRIVQRPDQRAGRPPVFEPGVGTPIPEDAQAGLGLPQAAGAVAGRRPEGRLRFPCTRGRRPS